MCIHEMHFMHVHSIPVACVGVGITRFPVFYGELTRILVHNDSIHSSKKCASKCQVSIRPHAVVWEFLFIESKNVYQLKSDDEYFLGI